MRMRLVISSACCISSNDSLRVCSAISVNPQFACILECRKYWLIAVSSLVNCSLSNFRTSGSPCMLAPCGGRFVIRWLFLTGSNLVHAQTPPRQVVQCVGRVCALAATNFDMPGEDERRRLAWLG